MDLRVFVDIVGLYYCIDECGHEGVTEPLISELGKRPYRLSGISGVIIVKMWDKSRDIGDEIVKFEKETKSMIAGKLRINVRNLREEQCDGSKVREPCDDIICTVHKAYCCACDASKGDLIIAMKAGSSADCQIGGRTSLQFSDGVKEESVALNCDQVQGIGCPILICRKIR